MALNYDLGGNDLIVNTLSVGATSPGQAGTSLSGTELAYLDTVTAGTATASKAVVLDSSKGIATITSATITTLTSTAVTTGTLTASGAVSTGGLSATTLSLSSTLTAGSTSAFTGAITPTGGVAAAGGYSVSPRNMHTGGNPASVSTDFSNVTIVITETYRSEVFVPANCTSTGVAIFNGAATGGNVTAFLIDSTGAQITGCNTAATAQTGIDSYQRIPWSAGTVTLKGPATYWVAVQGSATAGNFNCHTIGNFGADKQTGTTAGTLTVATAPTTFTTAQGIVASLY